MTDQPAAVTHWNVTFHALPAILLFSRQIGMNKYIAPVIFMIIFHHHCKNDVC